MVRRRPLGLDASLLLVLHHLQVQKVVGCRAIDVLCVLCKLAVLIAAWVVLEHHGRDVDGVRVELGRRRDGVVPGLKARDERDDAVEGNVPLLDGDGAVEGVGKDILPVSGHEDLGEGQAFLSNFVVVDLLVGSPLLKQLARLRSLWRPAGQSTTRLA